MAFTEHRFPRAEITLSVADITARSQAKRGDAGFLEFASGIVAGRLHSDRAAYRWYGPWWWSLKEALRRAGHDFGEQSDPLVRRAYGFEDDAETLVAAEKFREWYMATQFIGTRRFHLDPATAEHYDLWDGDMEDPANAPA